MSAESDALDRLVVTIVSVRRQFGARAYREALLEARRAVAVLVLREAEARAGNLSGLSTGHVIPLRSAVESVAKRGTQEENETNESN